MALKTRYSEYHIGSLTIRGCW